MLELPGLIWLRWHTTGSAETHPLTSGCNSASNSKALAAVGGYERGYATHAKVLISEHQGKKFDAGLTSARSHEFRRSMFKRRRGRHLPEYLCSLASVTIRKSETRNVKMSTVPVVIRI